jgi:hypothetical protein
MALLNTAIRWTAITGRRDYVDSWLAGRQTGPWAVQPVRPKVPRDGAKPPAAGSAPAADPAETLRELRDLHRRGVITDAELETLRSSLGD